MHGAEIYLLYILLIVGFSLLAPVLAVSAWLRVRRLQRQVEEGGGSEAETRGGDLRAQLRGIELRLLNLEEHQRQVAQELQSRLRAAAPSPAAPPAPVPTAAAPGPGAPESPPRTAPFPPAQRRPSLPPEPGARGARGGEGAGLEQMIAGRWLNRVAIVALLFGMAFFLRYAFDNDWVGNRGRVAIGLVIGTALLFCSQWLLGRGYTYFSEGITGLGAAVHYLSLYAAYAYYSLVPQWVAFGGMVVVAGAVAAIALGRDSQRIALVALSGGFLTPVLLSTGENRQVELFIYLAILDAGLLALGRARDWRGLEIMSLFATQAYFWGWYTSFYAPEVMGRTAAFATLFFVLFALPPALRARAGRTLENDQIVLVLLNALSIAVALRRMLWPESPWALTIGILALAAAHLAMAAAARPAGAARAPAAHPVAPSRDTAPQLARILFGGLALTFATLAIPVQLEGRWLTIAWAVEAAVLAWSGVRARVRLLRLAALGLFAVVAMRLLAFPIPATAFLWNARFAAFAVTLACMGFALRAAQREGDALDAEEQPLFAALGVVLCFLGLWVLSHEVWDWLGERSYPGEIAPDRRLAQHLGLSVLWTLYATGLLLAGIFRRQAALRWQGLILFGVVVGKVFLHDLSFLRQFYRIVSFVVLGLVLLAVSFLYQRRAAGERTGGG